MTLVTTRQLVTTCPRCLTASLTVRYVPATPGSLVYIDDLTACCDCWTAEETDALLHDEASPSAFVEGLEALVTQFEALKEVAA